MANKYLIIRIDSNSLESHGDVFIVYANRVTPVSFLKDFWKGFTMRVDETLTRDTELFVFPQKEEIFLSLDEIGKNHSLWEPNMRNFTDGKLFLENNVKRTAHYHDSLFERPVVFHFKAESITFNNRDWSQYKGNWDFSVCDVFTPLGNLEIADYQQVEQNGLVGFELETYGTLNFGDIPEYKGKDKNIDVRTIAILRQPDSDEISLFLFDEDDNSIATISQFSGRKALNAEFSDFLTALRNEYE